MPRALRCPWACDGRAREHCARVNQYSSARLIGSGYLTEKERLEGARSEGFQAIGLFRSLEIKLDENE